MPEKNDQTTEETTETTELTEPNTPDETTDTATEGNEPEWKKEITKVQNETQSSIARLESRVSELIGKVAVNPQATDTEPVTVVVQESTRNRSANASEDSTEATNNQTEQTNQNNENNDQTPEPPVRHVGGVLSRRRR